MTFGAHARALPLTTRPPFLRARSCLPRVYEMSNFKTIETDNKTKDQLHGRRSEQEKPKTINTTYLAR